MSILELWLPVLLFTSATISLLIWLVQGIAFQFARERGLIAVFLAQLTLSVLVISALIFASIRAIGTNEVNGPVVFGIIIFHSAGWFYTHSACRQYYLLC